MAKRKFVTDYLVKVAEHYKEAAAAIAAKYSEYKGTSDKIKAVYSSPLLTPEGRRKEVDRLAEKQKELQHEIEGIRAEANLFAADMMKSADRWFGDFYRVKPADIDAQVVALLNANVLKPVELVKMAETANPATKRIIAGKLREKGYLTDAERIQRTLDAAHVSAMDSMMELGDYFCGGARMSGFGICKVAANKFDEMAAPIIAAAPRLVADTDYQTMQTTVTLEA